jgi:hypothetical protein
MNSTQNFISRVRKVKGEKIEIEVSEFKQSNRGNLVALLNKGDERFSANAARKGWLVGTLQGITESIPGIAEIANRVAQGALGAYEGRDANNKDANLAPALMVDGAELGVQIKEDTKPLTKYQAETGTGIKRKGKDGPVMTHGGLPIYSATFVVVKGSVEDILLQADEVSDTVATEIPSSLQNAQVS